MTFKKDQRVGVILDASLAENIIVFAGFGQVLGLEVPSKDAVGQGPYHAAKGIASPKIKLDTGETVYACEGCWIGDEDKVKAFLEKHPKVDGTIQDYRRNYKD